MEFNFFYPFTDKNTIIKQNSIFSSALFYIIILNYINDFVKLRINIMKNVKIGLGLQLFLSLYIYIVFHRYSSFKFNYNYHMIFVSHKYATQNICIYIDSVTRRKELILSYGSNLASCVRLGSFVCIDVRWCNCNVKCEV